MSDSTTAVCETKEPNKVNDLLYNLFYPSILGSIIFDYCDPVRFGLNERLGLIAVPLAFIVDYWHLKNNIKSHESFKPSFRVLDFVVTILFLWSYYTFSLAFTIQSATTLEIPLAEIKAPTADIKLLIPSDFPKNADTLLFRGMALMSLALGVVLVYDWKKFPETFRRHVGISIRVFAVALFGIWISYTQFNKRPWFWVSSSLLAVLYFFYVALWPTSSVWKRNRAQ